jgi:hypothetical protein
MQHKFLAAIAALLSIIIVAPIWYWLLYHILVRVQASELMFFLYWVYVPMAFVTATISKLLEKSAQK